MSKKCVVLLSGGLDSLLVTRLMTVQGIETVAVHTVNCFHGTKNLETKKEKLRADALRLGAADIRFPDITEDVVALTKRPLHGRGRHLNACIDCRLRTVRAGFAVMREVGADFVATGEVVGQRPMSQRRDAMMLADRETEAWGCGGLLLRPLSAKLLPPTIPEEEGWVDPARLYDISGRMRERQMELAVELGLGEYPTPAGGCLLTDQGYSDRLKVLARFMPGWGAREAELLKVGRPYQIAAGTRLVASRNEDENYRLRDLCGPDDLFYINAERNGAIVMLRGEVFPEAEAAAAGLAVHYSKSRTDGKAVVERWRVVDGVDVDAVRFEANVVDPERVRDMERTLLAAR